MWVVSRVNGSLISLTVRVLVLASAPRPRAAQLTSNVVLITINTLRADHVGCSAPSCLTIPAPHPVERHHGEIWNR